jgi:hypothetical protein
MAEKLVKAPQETHRVRGLLIPARLLAAALVCGGCVTERVSPERVEVPKLLELPESVLPAGAYHGVTFFFEIDVRKDFSGTSTVESSELPDVAEWMSEEGQLELPPIVPEIAPGGREIYRVRDIHRVDYENTFFQVGGYRYPRQPRARLYVFKKRQGEFNFKFRGQPISVPADKLWIPSIYYYPLEQATEDGRTLVKEVLQLGLSTIETVPEEGYWLMDGKRYYPDTGRPLELHGAIHSIPTR